MSMGSGNNGFKNLLVMSMTNRGVEGLVRPFLPPLVPIFMLHQFRNPETGRPGHDPQMVSDNLTYLKKRGYAFLSLDEALDRFNQPAVKRHKAVVFTMDDGFREQVSTASEIFEAHHCPATCFLITDFLDGLSWPWDAQISFLTYATERPSISLESERFRGDYDTSTQSSKRRTARELKALIKFKEPAGVDQLLDELAIETGVSIPQLPPKGYEPLTWDEARGLETRGMSFGAHSKSHRILSSLSAADAREEIQGAKTRLGQELEIPSNVFCYPVGLKGHFGEREVELVKQAGYKAAVSAEPGYLTPASYSLEKFGLPRFSFPDKREDFLQYCSWIEYSKNRVLNREA